MADRLAGCWASEPKHTAKDDLRKKSQEQVFITKSQNTISKYVLIHNAQARGYLH